MMRLLPTAEVGFLGMVRNEETLEASTYAERLPDDLSGRQCYVLDPMLATGGTLAAAIQFLTRRGADDITAICLLAAPEGCERLEKELAGTNVPVTVVTAAMDEKLNDKGYIVPGLGDAGDRLYGVVGRVGPLSPVSPGRPAPCRWRSGSGSPPPAARARRRSTPCSPASRSDSGASYRCPSGRAMRSSSSLTMSSPRGRCVRWFNASVRGKSRSGRRLSTGLPSPGARARAPGMSTA